MVTYHSTSFIRDGAGVVLNDSYVVNGVSFVLLLLSKTKLPPAFVCKVDTFASQTDFRHTLFLEEAFIKVNATVYMQSKNSALRYYSMS